MTSLNAEAAMRHALQLARRGLGATAENPAVGCVIVRDGRVVGRGWTQAGGRPHAETVALAQAGVAAEGAEVYVTLEPCAHHGQTPPCVDALIAAKVAKVVVALQDPDLAVDGAGLERLRAAGIVTELGLCLSEALFLNQGYVLRHTIGRPLVAAKVAITQDGCLALANGRSQWITAKPARRRAQGIRAHFDCLLSGIGTVLADDPALTCRLPGLESRLRLRAICDSLLRLPEESRLVRQVAAHPLRLYCLPEVADSAKAHRLRQCGVEVCAVAAEEKETRISLGGVLSDLARMGVNRVLLEAGKILTTAALRQRLIDRLFLFRGNQLFGDDAQGAFGALGLETLAEAAQLHRIAEEMLGVDRLETFLPEYPD